MPRFTPRAVRDRVLKEAQRFRTAREPQRWVGLDFGSQSIKLVEVEQTASGLRLIKSLIQELPVSQDAHPIDRAGWCESALKEFDVRKVHASVSGSEVAIRRVHMPLMSKRELLEAVKWQVKEQVSFPIQDAQLDFRVLGEVWDKDIRKQDVLIAVASHAFIQELMAVVERSGVRIASLSPSQSAMWRCVTTLIPEAGQGSVAVIEIGARETEVTIAKDGHIRLVRDLAVGSASMTEALIGVVTSEGGETIIDHSKAEALKRRYGVLAEAAEGATEEGIPLFHLSSLMRPVLESLLTELSRILSFYRLQVDEAGVSRVLLCGGGAGLKQLQPFLAEGLGMTVEVFNPVIRITDRVQSLEPEQIAEGGPRLAVAIGLALDHGQGLNLLPVDLQRTRTSAISQRRVWLVVAKGLAAVAFVMYLGFQLTAALLQRQVHDQQKVWAELKLSYARCMTMTSTCNMLEETMRKMRGFLDQQPVWEGLFKEVGELMPPTIELNELAAVAEESIGLSAMRFRLKGRAASRGLAGEGSIAQFMEAMERSIFFADVELVSSEMRTSDTEKTSFEIEGSLE